MNQRYISRLDELNQSVPPPRDLWPAIAAALDAQGSGDVTAARRRYSRWQPVAGLAAAVALVAIGVLIGQRLQSSAPQSQLAQSGAQDAAFIPAALRDENYRKQRDALLVEVQHRLAAMPEGERAKVAASLATLRRSIAEIEAALGRDPANALLQDLLVSSCQEEMRALTAVRDSGHQEI
jgi:hypothetical protein